MRNVVMIVLLAAFMEMLIPGEDMGRYVRLVMGLFVIIAMLTPVLGILGNGQAFEVTAYGNIGNESNKSINTILQRGEEIRQQGRQAALAEYRVRLARQVQAVVQLVRGVRRAEVEVEVEGDEEVQIGGEARGEQNTGGLGAILRVAVLAEVGVEPAKPPPSSGTVAPVKPVEIKPGVEQSQPGGSGTEPPGSGLDPSGQSGEGVKPPGNQLEPPGGRIGPPGGWPAEQLDLDEIKREIIQTVSNFYSIRPEQVQVIVVTE